MLITDDTICAIATAHGMGAIATIRLAGPQAIAIADSVFRSPKPGKSLTQQKGGTLHFGTITDGTDDIDEVVAAIFRKPHSFTGEDIVEISCHGSTHIQSRIMQLLISRGARTAMPGEFTQRAFANGKMDLSQAEAVADLIASQNDTARKVALRQMRGGFSNELKALRDKLLHFTSLLELELDFSEEDVEFADRTELISLISTIDTLVVRLAKSFSIGNAIKNGVPVAIVGPTNAGKSTLLNALLNEERAIVSDIHGTTRDTIEDTVAIDGLTFRFIDTAGIRHTTDTIEAIGIDRTYAKMEQAAIVLLLIDAQSTAAEQQEAIDTVAARIDSENQTLIIAYNKADLGHAVGVPATHVPHTAIAISAKERTGLNELCSLLVEASRIPAADSDETIVTNIRHYEALVGSHQALERVANGLTSGLSGELVAIDIHEALDALANITGEVSSQDVLNNIFKNFCIGK